MKKEQLFTTLDNVSIHDTTMPLLQAMYLEFKELSKKKPDAVVSKSKINITNRLLEKVRVVLCDEDSIDFLDLLNEDDVPQSSDVTLILSQYVAAMKAFHDKYYGWDGSDHSWFAKQKSDLVEKKRDFWGRPLNYWFLRIAGRTVTIYCYYNKYGLKRGLCEA